MIDFRVLRFSTLLHFEKETVIWNLNRLFFFIQNKSSFGPFSESDLNPKKWSRIQ